MKLCYILFPHLIISSRMSNGADGFHFKRLNHFRSVNPSSERPLVLHMSQNDLDNDDASSLNMSRRDVIMKSSSASLFFAACGSKPQSVYASQPADDMVHMSASWSAVDGLNSLNEGKKFVSFDQSAYKAMKGR